MIEQITKLYTDFLQFANNNQIIAGAISLWGLTVLTFFCRTIPLRVYNFIYRQCTTTLVINNYDSIYEEFLEWVSKNNMHSFVRNLIFSNKGRWSEGTPMITIGYGRTFFIYKRRLFSMNRLKEDANQTVQVKESIAINLYGRSHKLFASLFDEISVEKETDHLLDIHVWNDNHWSYKNTQHKRDFDTVIIEQEKKKELHEHVDLFWKSREWYMKYGIPWRTGILLTGPAGTGKTSIIKAICSHYNKHLYIINLATITDTKLDEAMNSIPYNAIVAMEDIDTAGIGKRRDKKRSELAIQGSESGYTMNVTPNGRASEYKYISGEISSSDENEEDDSKNYMLSLGGVLNAIDGITSSEGRILIATANNPEKLDRALIRPGRFDMSMEIGYMTDETMRDYLAMFFNDDTSQWEVKDGIAPCSMPKLVSDNRDDITPVLEKIATKKKDTENDS